MRAAWLIGLAACGSQAPEGPDKPAGPGLEWEREALLPREPGNQQTANVRLAPLGWGAAVELVAAETSPPRLSWVGCGAEGCTSRDLPLPDGLVPVRTATADLDGDGDNDLVVASIGELEPTDDRVGSAWIGWNDANALVFEQIAADMGRTCCAEPGDLDGDGDLDLALCVFGHQTVGALGWLEQTPAGWIKRVLEFRPGAIHSFPVDVDGDGDLDLLTAVSQLDEQVVLHRNDGAGGFTPEIVLDRESPWHGISGLEPVDLDQDGDLDVLLHNGDTMDGNFPEELDPSVLHGVVWLDNDGTGRFTEREVGRNWGAYAVRALDVDGDGDLDVALASLAMEQSWPALKAAPLVVFLNDGAQGFERVEVPDAPPELVTLEVADLNEDGKLDLVVGSLEMEPDSRTVRLSAFIRR